MRRAVRIAAWGVGALLAITLALLVSVLIAGNTQRGRALILQETARLSGGRVRPSGLSGSFPASIELERLELSDSRGVWLTAEGISLRWSALALLARHVDVALLRVARLDIERTPIPESEGNRASSLPKIDVEQFDVGTLELGAQLARVRTMLALSGTAHLRSLEDAEASVSARRIDGVAGHYELRLRFDPARMDARVQLTEPAGGTLESLLGIPGLGALSVVANLSGPRGAERIDLTASAGELQAGLAGTVDLGHQSADLAWSLAAPSMTLRPGLKWTRIALNGNWHGPLAAARASGTLRLEGLEASGAQLALLEGSMQADTSILRVHATAAGVRLPGPAPGLLAETPLNLDAALQLSDPQRTVQLTAEHRLFTLRAAIFTAKPPKATFEVRLPDLAPFAAIAGQDLRGRGELRGSVGIDGAATRLVVDGGAEVADAATLPARVLSGSSRLHLAMRVSQKSTEVEKFSFAGRTLSASITGRAVSGANSEAQSVEARYEAAVSSLAVLSPALAGTLQMKGQVSGPASSLATQLQLTSSLSIRGTPRETIQANIRASGLPARLNVALQAQGSLEGAPLELTASVERAADGTFRLLVPHAAWRSARLQADLTTSDNLTPQRGTAQARVDRLADLQPILGMPLAGRVTAELTVRAVNQAAHARLRLDAEELQLAGIPLNAQLSAEGPLNALALRVMAQSANVNGTPASLEGVARLNLDDHTLYVARAVAQYRQQNLRLLLPATVAFADGVTLSSARFGIQRAVIELQGRLSPAPDLNAAVHKVDAELVNAFVPGLLAQGTLEAEAAIHGSFSAPSGSVNLNAQSVRFASRAGRDLHALGARVSARLTGTSADLDAHLDAGASSHLVLSGSAPLSTQGELDLKLTGALDASLANPLLEARGERATGTIAVDATVTGAATAPQIGGTVDITQGDLRDYTQGLHLSAITGRLSGSAGTLKIERLVAHAAPGQLSVTGTIGVLQPKMPVDLQLSATNAQPITSDLLTTNLDAALKITGTLQERIDLSGTIDLHRTMIGIPNALPPDVAVLDVRRPGSAAAPERQLVVGLDLHLRAPREILVQGRGLNAELGGELQIGGTTENAHVTGSFDMIRGTFALASSQLTFTDGHVSFNGAGLNNRIDPSLDFTAQATAANATTTLHVTGLATAPQFTLSSTPPLPEDEILARLLFGESASQLTALQIAQIGVALATLSGVGGGGPNPLAKVQKALGLDRLSVGSGATNPTTGQTTGAALQAGRYVSSRVFVGAKQSTTGYSQVEVDVDLTKHLKLQTRLGNGTAIQGTTPENDPGSTIGFVYQLEY